MALVKRTALGTLGRESTLHQRHSDQSGSGANLTVSTPSGNVRRILFVTVKYTAAATVNVTITINSGAGASWDTLIQTIALYGSTDGIFIPDEDIIISDDDVIDVFAPLLAAETSAVAIYSEVF